MDFLFVDDVVINVRNLVAVYPKSTVSPVSGKVLSYTVIVLDTGDEIRTEVSAEAIQEKIEEIVRNGRRED